MLVIISSFVLFACGVQHRFAETDEGAGDSSFIYSLPFQQGNSYLLVQGYNSKFSHRGRLSLDFKMKPGTPVTAARSGVVTRVQQSYKKGGLHKKYLREANVILIRHNDGTQAMYAHLKQNGVAVNVGDTIQQGQVIGYSGNTGYSAFPHLHFSVWSNTAQGRKQLPTRFYTSKGPQYLRAGKWYRAM